MAETQALAGLGIKLKVEGESQGQFDEIAEVLDVNGPALRLDTQDATHHGSEEGWEEVIGTILRTGEVTFDIHFLPGNAGHKRLIEYMRARAKKTWQLVFPDPAETTWTFKALVTGLQPAAPVDGKLTASVTLKPSGKPNLDDEE